MVSCDLPMMASTAVTGTAHNTVFNAKPTNRRIWEPFRIPLAEVRQIKKALGASGYTFLHTSEHKIK
jgi:hypothetical protein